MNAPVRNFVCLCAALAAFASCGKDDPATEVKPPEPAVATPTTEAKPQPVTPPAPAPAPTKPAAVATPQTLTLPARTALAVVLKDSVGTDTHLEGAAFEGTLSDPLKVDGKVAVPAGARVTGKVVESVSPGRVKGRARIALVVEGVVVGRKAVPVATDTLVTEGKAERKKDAGMIAGGAAAGAVIGGILGGKDGALKGAAAGGAAGTGAALATKGDEVRYAPGTRLEFRLREPLKVVR